MGAQPVVPDGVPGDDGRQRCAWAVGPWLLPYHDDEWGVPVHDDRHHFEHLVLEGAQAGLSWLTVLKRRDAYRAAFAGFDPEAVAAFGADEVERLLDNAGIIRNRRKIEAAVANAQAVCDLQGEMGSFDAYLWDWVGGSPLVGGWESDAQIPPTTQLGERLSKDLRRRGFRFVGPIVVYSHLQSVGAVMDHVRSCFRFEELGGT